MAIGNAPWPIGVTMVGIHARTGREKIFAQNVARILFQAPFGANNFYLGLYKSQLSVTNDGHVWGQNTTKLKTQIK